MSSLYDPIQIPPQQQYTGYGETANTVALVSKSLLTRQSIARKLTVVGVTVFELSHFDALFQDSHFRPPDIVLIDTAAQELEWKAQVSLLKIFHQRTQVILLVSSMSVEQAVEAASSGVAAIFIKPYKEEKHNERIIDLLNETHRVAPKRLQPRFTPEKDSQIQLDYRPLDEQLVLSMDVHDISEKGAQLQLPYGERAPELQPGSSGIPAILSVGNTRIAVDFSVAHRRGRTIGVVFGSMGEGRRDFINLIHGLSIRAFGEEQKRRRW